MAFSHRGCYSERGCRTHGRRSFQVSIPTKIAAFLQSYPNTVLTRKLIFRQCWGREYTSFDANTFWVNVHLARRLLKSGRIVLVKKGGYKWVP
ncbi:MAG: helix-turn-helix domain-containing protein [Promethearchaeota archaeon]